MSLFLAAFGLGVGACGLWLRPWGGLLLLWPAWSALLLSVLYLFNQPRGLGKRKRGSLSVFSWLLFAPFLVFRFVVAKAQIAWFHEPACQEVAPGLWIARRIRARDIPPEVPHAMRRIVDLTAEFAEPRDMRTQPDWRWIPILDAGIPNASSRAKLKVLAEELQEAPGPVLIHCAQGHGRSATVAAWLMLRLGRANGVAEALAQIQSVRPGARVRRCQRRWLEAQFPAGRRESGISAPANA